MKNISKKVLGYFTATVASMFAMVGTASAALDPAVDTAFTAIQTDALALISKGFILAGAVLTAMIILGMLSKVFSKATG